MRIKLKKRKKYLCIFLIIKNLFKLKKLKLLNKKNNVKITFKIIHQLFK